jgi:hypothetical protein
MREQRKERGSGGTHAHAVIVSANREMVGMGGRERGAEEEEERVMGSLALSAVDSALGIRFPSLFRYNALLFFSSR